MAVFLMYCAGRVLNRRRKGPAGSITFSKQFTCSRSREREVGKNLPEIELRLLNTSDRT